MVEITVRTGTIGEVIEINEQILEFEYHFPKEHFEKTLSGKEFLIAVALVDGKVAGFQISWLDRLNNWTQRWVSAVIKDYRGLGVLKELEVFRDKWSLENGIHRIKSNVNNKRKEMLVANIKMGYSIIGIETGDEVERNVIYFEKKI